MLRNDFNDFAFEHRSGCCATEPGYAGDIGAIEIWLIDWLIVCTFNVWSVSACMPGLRVKADCSLTLACWCYGIVSSILLLNTDLAVAPLSLALPGIFVLCLFDWLIHLHISNFILYVEDRPWFVHMDPRVSRWRSIRKRRQRQRQRETERESDNKGLCQKAAFIFPISSPGLADLYIIL